MIKTKLVQRFVVGIGVAAIAVALCCVTMAGDLANETSLADVDAEQYTGFMENKALDVADLAEGAEIQRRLFNQITPPSGMLRQPMFPPVVPFETTNFAEEFLARLLGEDQNSVTVYPLTLALDPKTRETLIFNADGQLMATLPVEKDAPAWPEGADPARVTLQLGLLPTENVEPYLYVEERVAKASATSASKSAKSGGPARMSMRGNTNDFGICNIEKLPTATCG